MKYLPLILVLSACGSGAGQSVTKGTNNPPQVTAFGVVLTANLSSSNVQRNGSYVLPRSAGVIVPQTLTGISNSSEEARANLTFGTVSCAYQKPAGAQTYSQMPGQCGAYSAGSSVPLQAGETITLSLSPGYTTNDTGVEADVRVQ